MLGVGRLLSTTALVALGLTVATGAFAQDRKSGPIKLELGGYFELFFAFLSQDDGVGQGAAGAQDHGIVREGEIHFQGASALDNGLTIGLRVELENTTCVDQIDESYVYFESRFGEIRIGQDDAASNSMSFGTPTVVPSLSANDANLTVFFRPALNQTNSIPVASPGDFVGDSEKVIYFSPRISGLQVGLSYTPDGTETGTPRAGLPPLGNTNAADQQSKIFDIAANYIREIKGVEFGLMGGYAKAKVEAPTAGSTDQREWGVNGYISFSGVKVGGAYKNDNRGLSGRNERDVWAAGATYEVGAWGFGLEYAKETVQTTAPSGEDEVNAFLIGTRYTLGPGIDLSGALMRAEFTSSTQGPAGQNESWGLLFGTNLRF
jgi:outer membrane protein OmpU